jgi:hypothetical protein
MSKLLIYVALAGIFASSAMLTQAAFFASSSMV